MEGVKEKMKMIEEAPTQKNKVVKMTKKMGVFTGGGKRMGVVREGTKRMGIN